MSNNGEAFVKGGCGCLLAFLAIGAVALLLGGRVHLDLGGAICLFVFGGIAGLIVFAIYRKGLREGAQRRAKSDDGEG